MPRVCGVDIPANKQTWVALTYIYGVGKARALEAVRECGIDGTKRVKALTEEELSKLASFIESHYKIEGMLRREIAQNIQRLKDIRCYRGVRHIVGLPVRGQRTRTNARTRKGPRRTVAKKPSVKGRKG
ncbi:MAG: 30S ribosomal protein S13 [Planctomycetota bacterium]|nr:30S ribosomal protein S13 [Planctomycetota bacterium]